MGFFDLFKQPQQPPRVQSILPAAAVNEIMSGRLPVLNTDKIFLNGGEKCHYIDKAIYERKITGKRYVRHTNGYSFPGLFKGDRVHLGGGHTDTTENVQYKTSRGILYVTNQRIIFQGEDNGFHIRIADLVAIQPYSNCVELQCGKETYRLFVPNGNVVNAALHLIR